METTNDTITLDNVKSILLSKTFWFNTIIGSIALAAELNKEMLTSLGIPLEMQTTILHWAGVLAGIGNIYLRMQTKSGVVVKMPKIQPKVVNNENQ